MHGSLLVVLIDSSATDAFAALHESGYLMQLSLRVDAPQLASTVHWCLHSSCSVCYMLLQDCSSGG